MYFASQQPYRNGSTEDFSQFFKYPSILHCEEGYPAGRFEFHVSLSTPDLAVVDRRNLFRQRRAGFTIFEQAEMSYEYGRPDLSPTLIFPSRI
jgi:hypothetical protein